VVVVLAGGKNRIPKAVELWERVRGRQMPSHEPVLFLSGLGPSGGKETLEAQGVNPKTLALINGLNFVSENVSENTFENAQLFASFARQKQWKHVLLITAAYHMRRSEFILRKAVDPGMEILTSTVDSEHFGRNEWHKNEYSFRVTLIEYLKWLYYRKVY
jgi:uncharacterized SAM-binding protein YcdF (DUF218 family)